MSVRADAVSARLRELSVICGRYSASGHRFCERRNVMGCSIMPQLSRKPRIIALRRPGNPSGRPIRRNICASFAPSIRAASNMPSGSASKNFSMIKTGRGENAAGRTIAQRVSTRWKASRVRYWPIIVTWKGMSINTTYTANRILLPGNLYRAKLQAALMPMSCPIRESTAYPAEFQNMAKNSGESNSNSI